MKKNATTKNEQIYTAPAISVCEFRPESGIATTGPNSIVGPAQDEIHFWGEE